MEIVIKNGKEERHVISNERTLTDIIARHTNGNTVRIAVNESRYGLDVYVNEKRVPMFPWAEMRSRGESPARPFIHCHAEAECSENKIPDDKEV